MFDRWHLPDLGATRYVWLPVRFDGDAMTIPRRDYLTGPLTG
ncbi:MAG: hypothetical protein AAF800_01190 [Planctomycetota bacterium]